MGMDFFKQGCITSMTVFWKNQISKALTYIYTKSNSVFSIRLTVLMDVLERQVFWRKFTSQKFKSSWSTLLVFLVNCCHSHWWMNLNIWFNSGIIWFLKSINRWTFDRWSLGWMCPNIWLSFGIIWFLKSINSLWLSKSK